MFNRWRLRHQKTISRDIRAYWDILGEGGCKMQPTRNNKNQTQRHTPQRREHNILAAAVHLRMSFVFCVLCLVCFECKYVSCYGARFFLHNMGMPIGIAVEPFLIRLILSLSVSSPSLYLSLCVLPILVVVVVVFLWFGTGAFRLTNAMRPTASAISPSRSP